MEAQQLQSPVSAELRPVSTPYTTAITIDNDRGFRGLIKNTIEFELDNPPTVLMAESPQDTTNILIREMDGIKKRGGTIVAFVDRNFNPGERDNLGEKVAEKLREIAEQHGLSLDIVAVTSDTEGLEWTKEVIKKNSSGSNPLEKIVERIRAGHVAN